MRLDKFLQISRLVKRRTLAHSLCEGGHVAVNGTIAKASSTVRVGDHIVIDWGGRRLVARVQDVPDRARPTSDLVEILERVRVEEWWS